MFASIAFESILFQLRDLQFAAPAVVEENLIHCVIQRHEVV